MNSGKTAGKTMAAIVFASFLITPMSMAHPEHEEEGLRRIPVAIQPAANPAPAAEPKKDLPKIRFHAMDLNSDRKITRKEWQGKGVSFKKLDRNKDGVLSGAEVAVSAPANPPAK